MTTLLGSLRDPVDLSASPAPAGGVLIAERRSQSVSLWRVGADAATELVAGPPETLDDPDAAPTAISHLSAESFVVAWKRSDGGAPAIALYRLEDRQDEPATAELGSVRAAFGDESVAGPTELHSLARGVRFLYACAGPAPSKLLRARHNAGLLSRFRLVASLDHPAEACSETPRGYVLTTSSGELNFYDPTRTNEAPIATFDSGLRSITAIAYGTVARPHSRLLYAIGDSGATSRSHGVYRLDAGLDAHSNPICQARLVLATEDLRAMAFTADGALLLLQDGGRQPGRLLKVEQEL